MPVRFRPRAQIDNGLFSSAKVHCPQHGETHHCNGTTTCYHQLLGAELLHADHIAVLPLAPELAFKQDGARKNDCERDAAKRPLTYRLRRVSRRRFTALRTTAPAQKSYNPRLLFF